MARPVRSDDAVVPDIARVRAAFEAACPPGPVRLPAFGPQRLSHELTPVQRDVADAVLATLGDDGWPDLVRFVAETDLEEGERDERTTGFLIIAVEMLRERPRAETVEPLWERLTELLVRPLRYVDHGDGHDRTVYLCPNPEQTFELLLGHADLPGVAERLETLLAGSHCEGVGEESTYTARLEVRAWAIRRIARGRHARGELDADWVREVMIRQPETFDKTLVRSGSRRASGRHGEPTDGRSDGGGDGGTSTSGGTFLADYRRCTREATLAMVAELDRFAEPFLSLFYWTSFEGVEWVDAALGFLGTGRLPADELLDERAGSSVARIVQALLRATIDPTRDAKALGALFARHDPELVRAALPHLAEARPAALSAIGADDQAALERFARETCGPGGRWEDRVHNCPDPTNGVLDLSRARAAVAGLSPAEIRGVLRRLNDGEDYDFGTGLLLTAVAGIGRERIESALKQGRDVAIKAYGLLPLETDEELAERYARFVALRDRARRRSDYRRADSLAAVEAGLANLARVADATDTFALELRVLADGPHANVRLGDWRPCARWQIALTLDARRTRIVARRDKPLKSVPPALRTEPAFTALASMRDTLEPALARLADGLERAMCDARAFTASELELVRRTPLLADVFGALVFADDEGGSGLLDARGGTLVDIAGESRPIRGALRLAHVADGHSDLLARWHERLHALGVVQPIEQSGRVAFRPLDEARARSRIEAPDERLLHARRIESRLNGDGWRFDLHERESRGGPELGADGERYEPNVARRRATRGDWTVALRFSPIVWNRSMDHEGTRFRAIEFERAGTPCPLGEVDPVLLSETVALVSGLAGSLPLPTAKGKTERVPWMPGDIRRIEPPAIAPVAAENGIAGTTSGGEDEAGTKAADRARRKAEEKAERERVLLARREESRPSAHASDGLAGLLWGLASLRDERVPARDLKDPWDEAGERVRIALAASLGDGEDAAALEALLAGFERKTLRQALPFVDGAREAVLRHLGWSDEAIAFDALVRRIAVIELGARSGRYDAPPVHDIDFAALEAITLDAKTLGACLNVWTKMAEGAGSRPALYLIRATLGLDAERVERQVETMYPIAIEALGCAPVADRTGLAARYARLRALRAEAKHYGRERSTTIREAIEHGIAHLARRAGYTDATRLGWALQADAAAHRFDAWEAAGDWEIALVPDGGDVRIAIRKDGAPRKSVPAALRKESAWKAMRARQDAARAEAREAVRTLQAMMCAGASFSTEELDTVRRLPLVTRLLAGLVLEDGSGRIGLPDDSLGALRDEDGEHRAIEGGLRILHPLHLFERDRLGTWQRAIVAARVVQPFRQVFRELYVPTPAELECVSRSARFAGRAIDPAKTAALLHGRGYRLGDADHPFATRRFEREGVVATIEFDGLGWHHFAEESYGETPTIGELRFLVPGASPYDDHEGNESELPFTEVPPLVFSETMRDLDLVAAVAPADEGGGRAVSPEVIVTRAQLLRALFDDLGLGNVTVDERFVRVVGQRASYRIHLGSAVIHVEPGNYLCIVPASKRRPNVHLPFAEADRRFDEIVAKALMLADDAAITDSTILAQIRDQRPAA